MIAWRTFTKRRCRKTVDCDARLMGSRRDDGPERVQISFKTDDGPRLEVDMSVDEARVLGRGLLAMWPDRSTKQ